MNEERTELREHLAALNALDPWTHATMRLYVDAWAQGYEQAMRDAIDRLDSDGAHDAAGRVKGIFYSRSFSERRHDAFVHATDEQRRTEAEAVVALARLGEMLPVGRAFPGTAR